MPVIFSGTKNLSRCLTLSLTTRSVSVLTRVKVAPAGHTFCFSPSQYPQRFSANLIVSSDFPVSLKIMDSSPLGAPNYSNQQQDSAFVVTELETTDWTDEKHSLFLKSMEATFVDQLYKSLDLHGRSSQKNCTSGSKSAKNKLPGVFTRSGQFKVLNSGCWSKLNFTRDEPVVNQLEKYGVLSANPWIQHYRCPERRTNRKFLPTRVKAAIASHYHVCNCQLYRPDFSTDSNTEVTDQNFNDDNVEEVNAGGLVKEMKRTRTSSGTIVPGNDQVVPSETGAQV